jgi:hypothetical protein
MVGVAVRDEDDVRRERGRVGDRAVPLQRPERGSEERVGQDPDAVQADERGRVADESNRDLVRANAAAPRPGA